MFGFDDARESHQQVYGSGGYDNQASFSHEIIAGGAAFEGMKLYEDHQRKEGKKTLLVECDHNLYRFIRLAFYTYSKNFILQCS